MSNPNSTVADFLRSHPDATLNIMTPMGYAYITPELGAKLLAGGTLATNPGCPGREYEHIAEAEDILSLTLCSLVPDQSDPTLFHAMTDYAEETLAPEPEEEVPLQCQQM